MALSKALSKVNRRLRIARMFAPKPKLWFPFDHEKSSVKFRTGVIRVKVREKVSGENMKRKLIAFSLESPCWLKASRVKPNRKLFTILLLRVHVWPAAMPIGCDQIVGAGVSGNWRSRAMTS